MTLRPRVAYFCMEYGLDAALPIYSGGLGVLAGDYMKSAGDLRLPVLGIGILWGETHRQHVFATATPEDHYAATPRDALEPLDVDVHVEVSGKLVRLVAHRVTRHVDAPLYLLEPAAREDRWITARLYGGGPEARLAQEIVLGVGGVRLLRRLGIDVDVYHFNEGHAVLAGLELVRETRAGGATLDEAIFASRRCVAFTTHTPVEAGNETHDPELMRRLGAHLGLDAAELARIGGEPFGMTVAGLRLAGRANAVAARHGETARRMWRHIDDAAPIESVTNGVHAVTWQDRRVRAAQANGSDLWEVHQQLKRELIDLVAARTGARLAIHRPLGGFARRATPYKRADLILGDPARLERLLTAGLQLVFAGKAHPADHEGKRLLARLAAATRHFPDSIVFLENYDMALGAALTRGCDVWLNTPRPPLEASGTSGMKAAMNGVLNASVLDGWWPEGCRHGETGWCLDATGDDATDRAALYRVLENDILPRYYGDRAAWVRMMEASISMAQWRFSSDRMIESYYRLLYEPLAAARENRIHAA